MSYRDEEKTNRVALILRAQGTSYKEIGELLRVSEADAEKAVHAAVRQANIEVPKDEAALRVESGKVLACDSDKTEFLLKLNIHQFLCVRAGLIELAERKHPTTDWQGAKKLFDQITEEL